MKLAQYFQLKLVRLAAYVVPVLLSTLLTACGSTETLESSSSKGFVLWNGEDKASGSSWAQANVSSDSAEVAVETGVAHSGSTALHFKAAGSQWMGFGWNWHAYAGGVGTDATEYANISFMIKVEGEKLPRPNSITAQLASAGPGDQRSKSVNIADFGGENAVNGEWHKITMPLAVFLAKSDDSDLLDPALLSELSIGSWSADYINFSIYIDTIALE